MRLGELVDAVRDRPGFAELAVRDASPGAEVTAVVHDTRHLSAGALFCCVPGRRADGHQFAAAAADAGASALLCERPLLVPVPQLVVPSVRRAMGPLAAAFHGDPSAALEVVGVTGTNGKTTVTHLLQGILEADGRPTAVVGTLGGARTTPEATELQELLAGFRDRGDRAVAMEVSSHALDQHRVDGTRFRVAVFTNLSVDHLDYHGTLDDYFRAKARLFEPDLADRAVVNVDEPRGRLLLDAARVPTTGYSLADIDDLELSASGCRFTWRGAPVEIGLAGRFNVSNALAAAEAARALGVGDDAIRTGLASVRSVPGRFEVVESDAPFTVVVDYAHTPDGLEKLLGTARELAGPARVLVVVGCGGDRDQSKRPHMGRVASDLADRVVLTSDNPRSEDPGAIIDAMLAGIGDRDRVTVEPERRAAIALAVGEAAPGDVVVVAGKGHETTQVVGDRSLPFDDRVVAREAVLGRGSGS